ncbi:MAG TPA: hypothetical protein VIE63_07705, partial [Ramlibacter sp.]
MRALKFIGIFIGALVTLVVLAAAGLWVWAGTQASVDWALERAAQSQDIHAQGVEGSLRGGLKAAHIVWQKDGLKVEAFDAELAWQPLAIVRAMLDISRLHAARIRVEDSRPDQPKKIPANLRLPLRVEAPDVRVGQLQWVTPRQQAEVSGIAGAYSFNGVSHHVKLASAQWMQGSFSGE